MNKGLEALKLIKLNCCTFEDRNLYQNEFATIEKKLLIGDLAIKSLKYIYNLSPNDDFDTIDEQLQIVNNKIKALDIIRKYFYDGGCLFGEMTKEEFEFVKKVIKNESYN